MNQLGGPLNYLLVGSEATMMGVLHSSSMMME